MKRIVTTALTFMTIGVLQIAKTYVERRVDEKQHEQFHAKMNSKK